LKEVVLSSDSDKIINAPVLLSQLQKDSAVFKREILLSQEEMSNLVEMHIDKIENDYAQIGIWGGVLSVIFIIFGFFAIFKIEESKSEAKDVLNEVKELGRNASKEVEKLQNQATNLDSSLTKIRQDSNTFLETKTKELQSLVETETKAREELGEITKLLEEVKAKNAQYEWSIEAMHDQMKQLEALSNSLKDIIERNGKGGSNE
jgi:myosin heavy subunit